MKRIRIEEKEFLMKAKMGGLIGVALHVVVMAVFLQLQGCAMFKSGSASQDQPVVLPADDSSSGGILPSSGTAVPVAPVVSSTEKVYTVKKGDTLASIAAANGTTWQKLAASNHLSNPNQLKVGQEIHIAGSLGAAAPASRVTTPVSSRPIAGPIKPGSYVVQKGDMLSSIAKRSGLTVAEIKTANGMTSDGIVVGKKITIPKKGEAKAPAAAKPAVAKAAASAPAKPAVAAPALPSAAPMVEAAPAAAATDATAPAVTAPVVAAPAAVTAPAAAPAAAAPVASAASAPVYEHVLYPGETLDDVARQYGSSKQEIMKLNSITDPAAIKPGTKLLVPIPE